MITFTYTENEQYVLIEFELESATITPDVLQNLQPPDAVKAGFAHKGIILSGRGPIWLYAFLVHFYHPTKMVAVFDPRLNGAVVVATHSPDFQDGQIIPKESWNMKN